ncbi:endoglucanase [Methanobrevibacter arboriphilus]|uniref:Uncharacterized protein n=1 Tax=Methanobrevibacter arboriphilus TaxID=39441 RepID=A0ACA8R466_METAZ|nr:endoglucanase [Methanobrevibacter arboriphilus]BBL62002.1 hypothetical protein MarbSA_10420 [Methanobrevibacter arboriphilus]
MKSSNIIISVIIVLCIAAGVTAYSVTNPDNSIFSLPGYTPDSSSSDAGSSGVGDVNGTNNNNNNGASNSGGSSGSSSNSGGSTNGNSGSGGDSSQGGMTASQAKQIAQGVIQEPGAYAGDAQWDSSIQMWVVKVYDKNGNVVDGIGVEPNGHTNRV